MPAAKTSIANRAVDGRVAPTDEIPNEIGHQPKRSGLAPHQFHTRNDLNKPQRTRSKSSENAVNSTSPIDILPRRRRREIAQKHTRRQGEFLESSRPLATTAPTRWSRLFPAWLRLLTSSSKKTPSIRSISDLSSEKDPSVPAIVASLLA